VIVVSGRHMHAAARLQGSERVRAWVGELAIEALGLSLKAGKRQKTDHVDLHAANEEIARRFRQFQVTSMEAAMQIFGAGGGAAGGMGGPGSSLGQGSGPGPTMAMKPMPRPGGTTTMPALKSRGKRMRADVDIRHKNVDLHEKMPVKENPADKLKSSGYLGYEKATSTQRAKTKGASHSEMRSKLKGSGYYGYPDATDTQRQRMKAPKGSEFEDPKTRHKANYSSNPDLAELKGEAAHVKKIITDYKAARAAGYRHGKHELEAVAPPGMEDTVLGLKKHFPKGSASPFKLAWWMHNRKKQSA
jgi:hypothetical protein